MKRNMFILALVGLLVLALAGCGQPAATDDEGETPDVEAIPLILATTTSTADTGLLDVLNPAFEDEYPEYQVKAIAVGTGEALKMGERKEADVLLVHSKAAEEEFVAAGYGFDRRDVMYNDFIIVGPESDPAGIKGLDPSTALKTIAEKGETFVSRGDESGTHKKEVKLWSEAETTPEGDWYLVAGQGMGATLQIANDKQGYTLTDRGTFLASANLDLVIVVEKHDSLLNQYGVIEVTDAKNAEGAAAYAEFITSAEGQEIIENFGVDKFGQPLFFPNAR